MTIVTCEGKQCKNILLVRLGNTIGGTKLLGCPHCHRVYWME